MSKKIAVITASVGASNHIYKPTFPDSADYIAFVNPDQVDVSDGWDRRPFHNFSAIDDRFKDRRHAKIYKVLPFMFAPGYDYYIWHDSSHQVVVDPKSLVTTFLQDHILACFRHGVRKCAYDELKVIRKINIEHEEMCVQSEKFLRDKKYPEKNGLWELPVRMQRNTELTQRMGLMWWELICKYTSRDQVMFPYVLHTLGIEPHVLPGKALSYVGNNKLIPQKTFSKHSRK